MVDALKFHAIIFNYLAYTMPCIHKFADVTPNQLSSCYKQETPACILADKDTSNLITAAHAVSTYRARNKNGPMSERSEIY